MKIAAVVLLIAAAIAAVLAFGDVKLPGDVEAGEAIRSLLYGAIAFSIAGSLVLHYRGRLSAAILSLFAWVSIFGLVMVGYTYRSELSFVAERVMDEVVPGREVRGQPGEAVAIRGFNGHFSFNGLTNGTTLRYMFDTGASTVVLRNEDAKRIGINVDKLDYSVSVSTANGRTLAAPVTLNALTIGSITQKRVRALVGKPGALGENLLGMTFLSQLKGYAVEGNRLVLRQ